MHLNNNLKVEVHYFSEQGEKVNNLAPYPLIPCIWPEKTSSLPVRREDHLIGPHMYVYTQTGMQQKLLSYIFIAKDEIHLLNKP